MPAAYSIAFLFIVVIVTSAFVYPVILQLSANYTSSSMASGVQSNSSAVAAFTSIEMSVARLLIVGLY